MCWPWKLNGIHHQQHDFAKRSAGLDEQIWIVQSAKMDRSKSKTYSLASCSAGKSSKWTIFHSDVNLPEGNQQNEKFNQQTWGFVPKLGKTSISINTPHESGLMQSRRESQNRNHYNHHFTEQCRVLGDISG